MTKAYFDMNKIYKEYSKAKQLGDRNSNGSNNNVNEDQFNDLFTSPSSILQQYERRRERELTADEKNFLLAVERGDLATAKLYLENAQIHNNATQVANDRFNINCVDPLGRSALLIAIEYENIEMIELLLSHHVQVGEALLHAINEEFVEAVEILLAYQDQDPNSTESQVQVISNRSIFAPPFKQAEEPKIEISSMKESAEALAQIQSSKSFTPDITPLILASHKDNYEIIKILLDRGEQIPEPHDVRCNCADCVKSRKEDSLRYSKSRINAYKALASPSLISLSSKDPILTAFELSWELKRLSHIENEYKDDYEKLALSCQEYASALLAETRTSKELEIILNHDHESVPTIMGDDKTGLSRLKLAIKYKQKKFVAHSHCQQLLVSLWYEGLPSFRRRNLFLKIAIIILISMSYPILCILYLIMPNSRVGKIARQPFVKFTSHSASYVTFLFLLILASQRIKSVINDSSDSNSKSTGEKRGPLPTSIEFMILIYVLGFIWAEIKQLYSEGVEEYMSNWWNLIDFITNSLYVITIALRITAYLIVNAEQAAGKETAYYSREKWDPWDPTLISEGLFAAANIFSSLKLVYIFTINPHLGPLQISLGRMVFDIIKFSILILLVVFSFACGLNQLYWYYANMKEQECEHYHRDNLEDCLLKIKYFSNLFETIQTLFWGTFGLVEKDRMEIHRKHTFTMFVGLLMFGVYCTIMIIILINMLIAMMSNSYQIIANQSDEEWKFARSKLWMSYFEGGSTLPPPFSLIPSPKSFYYILKWLYQRFFCLRQQTRKQQRWLSIRKVMRKISEREYKYQAVVKELVKRYIMRQQRRDRNAGVTEDDLNEIKQDISGLRFELLDIFTTNGYKVDSLKQNFANKVGRKKGKINLEKTISKNFFDTNSNKSMFDPFVTFQLNEKNNSNTTKVRNRNQLSKLNSTDSTDSNSKEIKQNNSESNNQSLKSTITTLKSVKNTPTMYKVACKLRKIREHRLRKSNSECSPIKLSDETKKSECTDENIVEPKSILKSQQTFSTDEEEPIDSQALADVTSIPESITEEKFTERITEV